MKREYIHNVILVYTAVNVYLYILSQISHRRNQQFRNCEHTLTLNKMKDVKIIFNTASSVILQCIIHSIALQG